MAIKLFLGVPGGGKTLAMQDLVYESTKQGWPCFVIDNAFEWLTHTLDGEINIRWRGRPPFIIRAPHIDADEGELMGAIDEAYERNAALVFEKFDGWNPMAVANLMTIRGNAIYVDDEIDLFATYKGWEENPLRNFIHRGRHMPNADNEPTQVHVYGASRRPQNLHTDLTSMADEVFVFRIQGVNTLKRVVAEGYILPNDVEDARTMENLDFYKWNSGGQITRGFLKCVHGKSPGCATCKTKTKS
jgi:hypothetical protein